MVPVQITVPVIIMRYNSNIIMQHTLTVQIIVPVIITRHNNNVLVQNKLPIHNWSVQVTGLVILAQKNQDHKDMTLQEASRLLKPTLLWNRWLQEQYQCINSVIQSRTKPLGTGPRRPFPPPSKTIQEFSEYQPHLQ